MIKLSRPAKLESFSILLVERLKCLQDTRLPCRYEIAAFAIAEYQMAATPGKKREFPSTLELLLLYFRERNSQFDETFLQNLADAVQKVAQKSQTMYTGSAMFRGRLRIDLIFL